MRRASALIARGLLARGFTQQESTLIASSVSIGLHQSIGSDSSTINRHGSMESFTGMQQTRGFSFWPSSRRSPANQDTNQAFISGNRLESETGPDPSAWPLPETSLEASSALELAISAFEKSCIAAAQQETWLIPAWFISFFNAAHGYGLPWWAAIASVNLAARFLLLPFFIYQQKETARMASFNYDMIKVKHLQEAMTKAKTQDEQTHLHSAIKQEYSNVMAKYPNALMSFSSIPMVLVGNGLVFISIFQATSNLMNTKAPSLRDGGALWFTDLTMPDPYFGLPIICCLVTLALVEYGISMSGDQTPAGMQPGQAKAFKLMMRAMCLLFIPMGFVWSSGPSTLHQLFINSFYLTSCLLPLLRGT